MANPKQLNYHKLTDDFLASLSIMRASLDAFHGGTRDAYRVIAVELRKLMCDGANSLLHHMFEDFALQKLWFTHQNEVVPSVASALRIVAPGIISSRDGKTTFRLDFAPAISLMPLEQWLDQPFVGKWSVRQFIRSVSDKEGAHADPDYNDTLAWTRGTKLGGDHSHPFFVTAIAEYVLKVIDYDRPKIRKEVPLKRGPREGVEENDTQDPTTVTAESPPTQCAVCGQRIERGHGPGERYCSSDAARVQALLVRCKVAADISVRSGGKIPYTVKAEELVVRHSDSDRLVATGGSASTGALS